MIYYIFLILLSILVCNSVCWKDTGHMLVAKIAAKTLKAEGKH